MRANLARELLGAALVGLLLSPLTTGAQELVEVYREIHGPWTAAGYCGDLVVYSSGDALEVANPTINRSLEPIATLDLGEPSNGIAIAGTLAYIAMGSRGLIVVDLVNPHHPQVIWESAPGAAANVSVGNGLAVAKFSEGIRIFDLSDPREPQLVHQIFESAGAGGFAFAGNLMAYYRAGFGIVLLDVSSPASPSQVGVIAGHEFKDVALENGRAYVTRYRSTETHVFCFDVTDPANPVLLGQIDVGGGFYCVAIDGTVYVGGEFHDDSTYAISFADPASPQLLFSCKAGPFRRPVISRGRMLAKSGDIVQAFDIAGSQLTTSWTHAMPPSHVGVDLQGSRLATISPTRFRMYDIGSPGPPILRGDCRVRTSQEVHLDGDRAAVGSRTWINLVDISDPTRPTPLAYQVFVHDNAFFCAGSGIIAVSYWNQNDWGPRFLTYSTATGQPLATIDTTNLPHDLAISGSIALVVGYYDGLCIIDITDPTQPEVIAEVSTEGAYTVAACGDLAIVVSLDGVLTVIDISEPTQPKIRGTLALGASITSMDGGSGVVVIASGYRLLVVDLTDPDLPSIRQELELAAPATSVGLSGDMVVVGHGARGLVLLEFESSRTLAKDETSLPATLRAWPNPANPALNIGFTARQEGPLAVKVYDPRGRLVRTLWEGPHPSGTASFLWDGSDMAGQPVPSGVYLVRAQAGSERETVRVTLVR